MVKKLMNNKKISNIANLSDKQSWQRKYDNLQELVNEVNLLSSQIIELESKKYPIIDKISELRNEMVQECIHPNDLLVEVGEGLTLCKFCNKTFKML